MAQAAAGINDGGGPALYAGGNGFAAKWNGTSWSELAGMNGSVVSLMVFNDGGGPALYAGGVFYNAGGIPANRIAKWNGDNWSALGSGVDSYVLEDPVVYTMTVYDDGGGPAIYAGGSFTIAGGDGVGHIAKWDGASWSGLGSGTNGSLEALTVFDDGGGPAVYAGGGSAPSVESMPIPSRCLTAPTGLRWDWG